MRLASALLLCGLTLQVLAAAPPDVQIVPPPEPDKWSPLTGPAGRLVLLKAEPASTWHQVGGPQLDWRPVEKTGYVAVTGPAGVYRFTVASGGEVSRYELTLGDGPFVPPAPDSLVKDLRDRYAADTSPTKKADMASLAALYTLMVAESAKPEYATAAQLNETFVTARDKMLSDGRGGPVRLPTVRARCGQEVAKVIGDQADTPITAELRKSTGVTYARLSAAVTEAAK